MATYPVRYNDQNNDYLAHVQTYHAFLRGVRMAVGAAVLLLILMAAFLL